MCGVCEMLEFVYIQVNGLRLDGPISVQRLVYRSAFNLWNGCDCEITFLNEIITQIRQ